jgi:O-antigen/teichoic acid export membrane protein
MTQSTLAATPAAEGFADRVRSAVYWRWGSQVVAQIVTWTATIVVVRLLAPHDFGLFAMTQAVLAAFNFLNGYGFADSLIPADKIDRRKVGQVFAMLLLANAALAVTQFLAAPYAAAYYHQPMVTDMLRLQAVIFLATPFIALPTVLLSRRLDFRSQARVNLLSALVGACVALSLAWLGYGVWALVWAPIAIFGTRAIGLTIAARMLVWPVFDFRGAGETLRFGSALMLSQLFWIVQSQSDIFIAGHSFSPHDLGLYSEALFVALIFTGRFLPPLNEVAFPAYAELAKTGQPIGPAFLTGARLIMLATLPFYIGLSLVAGPLVETVFGPKWLAMIPILAGLALAMPAMALQIVCSPATNALGRARTYLITNASGAAIFFACFTIGIAWGPHGLVASWQVAAPLLLAVTLAATLPRIGVRLVELAAALLPAMIATAAMALCVMFLDRLIADRPAPLRLVLLVLTGMAAYAGVLLAVWPSLVRQVWSLVVRRSPVPAAA